MTYHEIQERLPHLITRVNKILTRLLEAHELIDHPHMVDESERLRLFGLLGIAELDARSLNASISGIMSDFPKGTKS